VRAVGGAGDLAGGERSDHHVSEPALAVIGSSISHYRILDELGRGGMGVVYRAVDTRLGREVALKFLPEQVAGDATALARFRREARAASALNHPNICTIYDVGEHEGTHFIAMELVRGESLAHRLESGAMQPGEICRIGAQLAGALEAAHAQGVVHRDVKPRNVFLTERGDAKLLDFGLAKLAPAPESTVTGVTLEADVTQEQRIVGTPSYMSPEQVLGRPLDGRSDIFSLGAVLYCMATGRRPFEAASVPEILASVLRQEPTPVPSINQEVPAGLARVIARCMAKSAEQRYADAGELRRDLEGVGRAIERGEEEASASTSWLRRPSRRATIAALGLALLATAAVLGMLALRDGGEDAVVADASPVIAVLGFTNQTGDAEKNYLGQAIAAGLASELGEIRALRLVSSGVLGADREAAVPKARDLGVQVFIEGDVRTAEEHRLSISARVTDARSGLVLWSQPFEGEPQQLVELEGRMARGLAGFLSIPLSRRERDRLGEGATASLEAMRLYAQGLLLLEGPAEGQGRERAIRAFEAAVELDPGFALAHASLSQALWIAFESSRDLAVLDRARAAAERAAEIDPSLPQAQLALALVESAGGGAASDLDVASILARHPRPAAAQRELGVLYERVGHLDRAERALRASTVEDPGDWFSWNTLGVFLFQHRDNSAAREAFQRAIDLAPPGVTRPRENLAALEIQSSRFDEAIRLLEEIPRASTDGFTANTLASAYFFSDRPDKWEKAEKHYLEAVARDPQRSEYRGNLADLYGAVGKVDDAQREYREAMRLAQAEHDTQPDEPYGRVLVALYAAKGQKCAEALEIAKDIAPRVEPSSQSLHQLALAFSICRDRERTMESLRGAIELGFPPAFAAREEEFRWLADDPSFTGLVASATTLPGASTAKKQR
jgi:serine/threonine-protein kinase